MRRTVSNLWSAQDSSDFKALQQDLEADLVVVGGGFTGCSAALEAARMGAKVVLLEAQEIAHGGSGRNVGLVNAGLWLPPKEVKKRLGEDAGARLITALADAPELVFGIIEREGIHCSANRVGTLHLAHSANGLLELQMRQEQYRAEGFPTQLLEKQETDRRTGTQAFHGAIWDPRAGTIQPHDYCQGLANAAQAAGAQIFARSPALSANRENDIWRISSQGHTIRSKHLLVATNAYPQHLSDNFTAEFTPVHYCQFATAPLPQALQDKILAGKEGCWDTAKVMSSFRMDAEGRFIIGGMGEFGGIYSGIHHNWAKRNMAKLFPELRDLAFEHQWSGRIAMTSDYLPKIVNFAPSAWSVFGYSGRGIAPGTLFGTKIAQSILSYEPDALPMPVLTRYNNKRLPFAEEYFNFGAAMVHAASARF